MRSYLGCFLLMIFFVCHSCQKDYAFTDAKVVPESGWTYDNILKYSFDVSDTQDLYNLYLEIDYLTSFPYQNMYVNVYTGVDESKMKKTQLSLDLSNKLGIWKGDCKGERCVYLMPLQESIFFEQAGKQYFWIEQFSRNKNLKGIQGVKFVGEKTGSREDLKPIKK